MTLMQGNARATPYLYLLSGPEAVMDSPVARERYRESLQQCADAISLELGAQERR